MHTNRLDSAELTQADRTLGRLDPDSSGLCANVYIHVTPIPRCNTSLVQSKYLNFVGRSPFCFKYVATPSKCRMGWSVAQSSGAALPIKPVQIRPCCSWTDSRQFSKSLQLSNVTCFRTYWERVWCKGGIFINRHRLSFMHIQPFVVSYHIAKTSGQVRIQTWNFWTTGEWQNIMTGPVSKWLSTFIGHIIEINFNGETKIL